MGPALTKLFEELKESTGVTGYVFFTPAQERRAVLFERHGKALIEALEGVLDESEEYTKNHVAAAALLAQLESEAQR